MDGCGCSQDNCENKKTTEEKIASLKQAIKNLGYKVEETENGEIKISNS
jgi:anti-sigma28 factor (negative regulator of flagellin synthesis)